MNSQDFVKLALQLARTLGFALMFGEVRRDSNTEFIAKTE